LDLTKILNKIRLIRFSMNFWLISKNLLWLLLIIYMLIRDYTLGEAFMINIFILLIHHCCKIHSISIGIMIGQDQNNSFKNNLFASYPTSIDKDELN